jgi:hypothetical protein
MNNKDLHELNKSFYYFDSLHIMLQQVKIIFGIALL